MRSSEPTFEKTFIQRICLTLGPVIVLCIAAVGYVGADEAGEVTRDAKYNSVIEQLVAIIDAIKYVLYAVAGALAVSMLGIYRMAKSAASSVAGAQSNHAAMLHNMDGKNVKAREGLERMLETGTFDREACEAALRQCETIAKMSLLNQNISMYYSGAGRETGEKLDMGAIVDRVLDVEGDLADLKGVAVEWTRPEEKIAIVSQDDAIDSLVRNLVSNAVKYTPKGGKVSVSLARGKTLVFRRPRIVLTVEDNGIGMDRTTKRRMYDRNFRADWKKESGTGLGLSLVRAIVFPAGGNIRCKTAEGKGTRFRVYLPPELLVKPWFGKRLWRRLRKRG